jgi:hypothetical protein
LGVLEHRSWLVLQKKEKMDFLKDEIEKRKREHEELKQATGAGPKKWVRRGDIEKERTKRQLEEDEVTEREKVITQIDHEEIKN